MVNHLLSLEELGEGDRAPGELQDVVDAPEGVVRWCLRTEEAEGRCQCAGEAGGSCPCAGGA